MHVAVYGGSFDPPHLAHQQAVRLVKADPSIDLVLVVPVFEHAFDKALVGFEHRLRMCELCMGGDRVQVSSIESELERPSYTLHTLQALLARHPEYQLRLVVGADVLQDTEKWHRFDEVRQLAPLYPLGRVGVECAEAPAAVLPDVSSTEVRSLLKRRRITPSVGGTIVSLLDAKTLRYIEEHELYL